MTFPPPWDNPPSDRRTEARFITVRKAWWGWWVEGRWCPTEKIRNHEVDMWRRMGYRVPG